jgi:4-hydroxy-tetrahydrodipicolinate reductase
VAGATGWTGRPLAEAVLAADDLRLVSAVSRSAAGQNLGRAWGGEANGLPVFGQVSDVLDAAARAAGWGSSRSATSR